MVMKGDYGELINGLELCKDKNNKYSENKKYLSRKESPVDFFIKLV